MDSCGIILFNECRDQPVSELSRFCLRSASWRMHPPVRHRLQDHRRRAPILPPNEPATPAPLPNCRHYERLKQRNPLKLWHRTCACGGRKSQAPNTKSQYENTAKHQHGEAPYPNEFETTYSPERPEIVYCEQCYQSEVVRLILSYVEGQYRGGVMSSIVGG